MPTYDLAAVETVGDNMADVVAVVFEPILGEGGIVVPHDGYVRGSGKGLLLAVELDRPCHELVSAALERGLLINVTAQTVVRLLPPLVEQAEQIVTIVIDIVRAFADRT